MKVDYISRLMELVRTGVDNGFSNEEILSSVLVDEVIANMIREKKVSIDAITLETQKYISLLSGKGKLPVILYGPMPYNPELDEMMNDASSEKKEINEENFSK